MERSLEFSPEQEDALHEVANIMMGHATTALARLSQTRIDIEIPRIELLDWEEGVRVASADSAILAGVRTRMLGKLTGEIYVTFPRESAFKLTDLLRGLPVGHTRYMSASAASTLTEVGNVLAGSCLAAFYQFLDISLVHSVPEFVYDVWGAFAQSETTGGREGDSVLLAQVTFSAPEVDLQGSLILLFTLESMVELVKALETNE